jgi:hypothetical protein
MVEGDGGCERLHLLLILNSGSPKGATWLRQQEAIASKNKFGTVLHHSSDPQIDEGLPEIKLSQFMDSTRLLLPLLPWEFDIFLVGSP